HQHPDIPAALAEAREKREQVRFGAGDAGHLLQMENRAVRHRRSTVARTPSAQCATEWRANTISRSSGLRLRSSDRSFSARSAGSARSNRSSSGSRSSNTGLDASTGTQDAAASYT